jgi:phosphate transport system substrate-binding protein
MGTARSGFPFLNFLSSIYEDVAMRRKVCKTLLLLVPSALGVVLLTSGCSPNTSGTKDNAATTTIRVKGSDTMVNVAKAWADKYYQKRPEVSVQVSGGGSGVGIAALINGTCDMADTSRKMNEAEINQVKQKRNVDPVEHVVGYDSIAIYVSKQNPLESISMEELAEIYGDNGTITKWSQLGVEVPKDEIVRVSRQNSSGTYVFFREAVMGEKRDYKPGAVEQSGSKDVVALVADTPSAIGYSGMGYKIDTVKVLKISRKKGEPGVEPTVENTKNGSYPITRPLQVYTAGAPAGAVKDYLDWIVSPEGQQLVLDLGYVPLSK